MSPAANVPGSRVLLRKLREIMEAGGSAQDRLNRLVSMIAATMVADVCSIYLKRAGFNELFATEGLKPEAVHRTRHLGLAVVEPVEQWPQRELF